MKISAANLNSGFTSKKQNFEGCKVITNNICNRGFQVLIDESKNTISKLGEKYNVKLSFKDNYWISPDGMYSGKLNSVVVLKIKNIDNSKNKIVRFIKNVLKPSYKSIVDVTAETNSISNREANQQKVVDSFNKWIKEEEIEFLKRKK